MKANGMEWKSDEDDVVRLKYGKKRTKSFLLLISS
jgi:hypothetical protein